MLSLSYPIFVAPGCVFLNRIVILKLAGAKTDTAA